MATVAIFFSGLAVGLAALILLGGGKHELAVPGARAAADKPDPTKDCYHLTETTPTRTTGFTPLFQNQAELKVWASREVYPSGKSLYFIHIGMGLPASKLAAKDIQALVKLDGKLKGKKPRDAKEVAAAVVHWRAVDHRNGKDYHLIYVLGQGVDGWAEASKSGKHRIDGVFAKDFIPTLDRVLKDLEALKKVKPSVSW
jgi:hypothetical protein